MADQTPTVSDMFGQPPADDYVPHARDLFGDPPPSSLEPLTGSLWDGVFGAARKVASAPADAINGALADIAGTLADSPPGLAAMRAMKRAHDAFLGSWADPISPQAEQELRQLHLFNDYSQHQQGFAQNLIEGVVRPLAFAFQVGSSAISAGSAAVGSLAQSAGLADETGAGQIERDLNTLVAGEGGKAGGAHPPALVARDPLTPFLLDRDAPSAYSPAMGDALRRMAPDQGVTAADMAGREAAPAAGPTGAAASEAVAPEAAEPSAPPSAPAAPDIHAVAREVAPDVMARYDALTARRDTYRRWLDELDQQRRTEAEANAPHSEEIAQLQGQIDDLNGRIADANPRKAKIYQARIEPLLDRLDELKSANEDHVAAVTATDTPDMARVRADLMKNDYAMRDLAPEVSAAYREAASRMPGEAPAEAAAGSTGEEAAQKPVEGPERETAPTQPSRETAAPEPAAPAGAPSSRAEAAPDVAATVERKLVAAGRPADEAAATGQLMAARYDARAAWFEGRKGTGAELYAKEGAGIVGAEKGGPKGAAAGKTRFDGQGRAMITLFRTKADASTIIHESGHVFLRELLRDAADAQAPDQLRADGETIRTWLGVGEGESIAPRHEEKFARAFERYLYEGRPPTLALAGAFERFRSWLLTVYQHMKGLGGAIPDEVRDVFDRLLSRHPERQEPSAPREPGTASPATTGPKPSRGEAMAAIHEHDAETTAPERASVVGDQVKLELARDIGNHDPDLLELNDGDGGRHAAGTDAGAGPRGDAGGVALGRGPDAGKTASAGELAALGKGVGHAAEEGAGPRAKPSGRASPRPTNPDEPFTDQPVADKAGNIRLDLLNAPEDVNAVCRQIARENGGFMTARRGVITDLMAMELADALGMRPAELNLRRIGQAFNAEQVLAARKLLVQSAAAVREASVKAVTSGAEADLRAYAETKARHVMIQGQVSGVTAEAGRALRAFRHLDGYGAARELGAQLQAATGQTLFQLRAEAEAVASMNTPGAVSRMVHDSQKPGFKDYLLSYYINNLISGPITHTTYAFGNAARNLVKTLVETPIAAGIGGIQEAVGQSHPERVRLAEVGHQWAGLAFGFNAGLKAARQALVSGVPFMKGLAEIEKAERGATDAASDLTAMGQHGGAMQPLSGLPGLAGQAGYVLETPGRAVTAIHTLFYSMAYEQEMAAMACRRAASEGLAGDALRRRVNDLTSTPPLDMIERAHAEALDMVLMRKPLFGSFSHKVEQLANANLATKLVVPFARVGTNIIRIASESSPLAPISAELRDTLAGKEGADRQQMAYARMAVGTGLGVTVGYLVAQEMATGGGPQDPNERRLWLVDHQPYSVRVGDRWLPYKKLLGPLGVVMGVAADMVEIGQHAGDEEITAIVRNVIMGFNEAVLDETWMRGLHDMMQAMFNPREYGENYIRNLSTAYIPFSVGLGQVSKMFDAYSKQASSLMDAVKAKVPLLSREVPNSIDWRGEPVGYKSVLYGSPAKEDPATQELSRLEIFPAKMRKEIAGASLNPQQYEEYQTVAGKLAYTAVNNLMQAPGYQQLPDHIRSAEIERQIKAARATAGNIMLVQHPELQERVRLEKLMHLYDRQGLDTDGLEAREKALE